MPAGEGLPHDSHLRQEHSGPGKRVIVAIAGKGLPPRGHGEFAGNGMLSPVLRGGSSTGGLFEPGRPVENPLRPLRRIEALYKRVSHLASSLAGTPKNVKRFCNIAQVCTSCRCVATVVIPCK